MNRLRISPSEPIPFDYLKFFMQGIKQGSLLKLDSDGGKAQNDFRERRIFQIPSVTRQALRIAFEIKHHPFGLKEVSGVSCCDILVVWRHNRIGGTHYAAK
jgi:hypothetical protein